MQIATPPCRDSGVEYYDEHVCFVCLFVCLHISRKGTHFLCMLPMAAAQSSSGSVVIHYVLRFLSMTTFFPVNGPCGSVMLQQQPHFSVL